MLGPLGDLQETSPGRLVPAGNSSNDYDYHYLRIKINYDHDLPLEKTPKLKDMSILVRSTFGNKIISFPQIFSEECFCK